MAQCASDEHRRIQSLVKEISVLVIDHGVAGIDTNVNKPLTDVVNSLRNFLIIDGSLFDKMRDQVAGPIYCRRLDEDLSPVQRFSFRRIQILSELR